MPAELPTRDIEAADLAADKAVAVRKYHRRRSKPGNPKRETDIKVALEAVRRAMKPLRSHIARFPYGPQTSAAEANRQRIREASARLQGERRKLWKMTKPPRKPDA